VASIHYTTDGTDPTLSSPTYVAPFGLNATTTVKYRAWDVAGNADSVRSQLVRIDTIAPQTSVLCNSVVCSPWYHVTPVRVSFVASDGGSGVSSTHYTTDGTDPTLSSPLYTVPFDVTTTKTVKFRSWDVAGNVESVRTVVIGVDKTAATTTVTCNSTACSGGWYNKTVTIAMSATDTGGSGVAAIHYTLDGSTPTLQSPVYGGPFPLSSSTTLKYFSVDVAGNSETVKTLTLKVDIVAPTISITSPADGSSFRRGTRLTITASASDNAGGSGVQMVTFYGSGVTLGSDSSSPYFIQYTIPSDTPPGTYVLTAVATDAAGNTKTSNPINVRVTT
jgi:hypothetical protein